MSGTPSSTPGASGKHHHCQSCVLGSGTRGSRTEVVLDTEGMGVEVGGWCPGSCISPQQTPPPLRARRGSSVSPASRTQQGSSMPSGDGAGGRSSGDSLSVLRWRLHAASSMSGTPPAGKGRQCEVPRACAMTGTFPSLLHFEEARPPPKSRAGLPAWPPQLHSLSSPQAPSWWQQVWVECCFQSGVRPHRGP